MGGEVGQQRRKSLDGRLLHACCVCPTLDVWGETWSYYASVKEEDDGTPYPKFCSAACKAHAGLCARNIQQSAIIAAKEREWRDPNPAPPPKRTYFDAAYEQQQKKIRNKLRW